MGEICDALCIAGSLIGKISEEIIPRLRDSNCLKSDIGLATINAVLNNTQEKLNVGNILDTATDVPSDTIGMVGMLKPVLNIGECDPKYLSI
mgnify:FL=1